MMAASVPVPLENDATAEDHLSHPPRSLRPVADSLSRANRNREVKPGHLALPARRQSNSAGASHRDPRDDSIERSKIGDSSDPPSAHPTPPMVAESCNNVSDTSRNCLRLRASIPKPTNPAH